MSAPRVLPAKVFDELQASAEKYGGVGAGWFTESMNDADSPPLCILGHANRLEVGTSAALFAADIDAVVSDGAVHDINARLGMESLFNRNTRVPFAHWCVKLGVERGA